MVKRGGPMGISTAPGMTAEEIVRLSREHTFFSWSVQGAVDPIAVDHAEGIYLYTPDGTRIIDFNSQLMSVNIGHGDRRVIDAITAQATKLQFVQPAFVTEPRARLGQKLAEIMPGDLDKVFFTLGGAEAIDGVGRTSPAWSGSSAIRTPTAGAKRNRARPPSRCRAWRTSSATRGRTRSRRYSSRPSWAQTGSSFRPTATSRASASCATATAS